MEFLEFINFINPAYWLVLSVIVLAISMFFVGDNFLPLISISIAMVAIVDYIGMGTISQLVIFSSTLILLMIVSPKLINKNSKLLIAEDITQMISKVVRVTQVDAVNVSLGKAKSKSGKVWNVMHCESKKLIVGESYKCIEAEGINLLVK